MNLLRSIAFNATFWAWNVLVCVANLWRLGQPKAVLLPRVRAYLDGLAALERRVAGLEHEVRGRENLPHGPFLVAAKHQSAWETLKLHALFGDPAVVYKRELVLIPVWGTFLAKLDMIPVGRGGGRRAGAASLLAAARRAAAAGRPIVVFPQGTRTRPGEVRPYQGGIGVLYERLRLPVVPLALNSGCFWPRRSFVKRRGRIVLEILPPIAPGLPRDRMLHELERRLEAGTARLVGEALGTAAPAPRHEPALDALSVLAPAAVAGESVADAV